MWNALLWPRNKVLQNCPAVHALPVPEASRWDDEFTHSLVIKTSTSAFDYSALTKWHQDSWIKLAHVRRYYEIKTISCVFLLFKSHNHPVDAEGCLCKLRLRVVWLLGQGHTAYNDRVRFNTRPAETKVQGSFKLPCAPFIVPHCAGSG